MAHFLSQKSHTPPHLRAIFPTASVDLEHRPVISITFLGRPQLERKSKRSSRRRERNGTLPFDIESIQDTSNPPSPVSLPVSFDSSFSQVARSFRTTARDCTASSFAPAASGAASFAVEGRDGFGFVRSRLGFQFAKLPVRSCVYEPR